MKTMYRTISLSAIAVLALACGLTSCGRPEGVETLPDVSVEYNGSKLQVPCK